MAKTTPLASSFYHIYTLPPPLPCPKVIAGTDDVHSVRRDVYETEEADRHPGPRKRMAKTTSKDAHGVWTLDGVVLPKTSGRSVGR